MHAIILLGFGFSGMATLVYEVAWTRSLSSVMGSSTYALSTILAAFMGGLSLGGWIGAKLSTRLRNTVVAFALCELGIGLMGLGTIPLINVSRPVYLTSFYTLHFSFSAFSIAQFLILFIIMGIPTTLMGMTLPLVLKFRMAVRKDAGKQTGHLYCINTFGAIMGSVLAGFLFIPAVGAKGATFFAASANIFTSSAILIFSKEYRKLAAGAAAAVICVSLVAISHGPDIPLLSYYSANRYHDYENAKKVSEHLNTSSKLVYSHEGIESNVYLVEDIINGTSRHILINSGKLEAGDDLGFALLAYLPYSIHSTVEAPKKALSIGMGSGNTLRHMAEFPLERIDCVELSEGILEANRRFLSPELFTDRRIRHFQADGRNFLLLAEEKYDLIIQSPSWAVEMASAALLTDEFFSMVSARLHKSGVFATWLDYFLMTEEDLATVLRTFRRSFPHSVLWHVDDDNLILVGSTDILIPQEERIHEAIERLNPGMGGRHRMLLADRDVQGIPDGPINTDDRPIVEFHNARNIILGPEAIHRIE
jgi:spermidine synthase